MNLIVRIVVLGPLGPLLSMLFFFGCAQKPVYVYPPKQPLLVTHTEKYSVQKTPPTTTAPSAAGTTITPPLAGPQKDLSRSNIVNTKPPLNNISELKKNISNEKISTDLIENKLSTEELETVAADNFFIALKPQVLLKIGKHFLKDRQPEKAAEYFRSITMLFPQSTHSVQATVLLSTIQLADNVDAKVIGAILPLTGKNASIGQRALNAIRMGLDLNNKENRLRLALFDSQGSPERAADGVDKLVKEDKAIALLGGFTSREATFIANRAELLSTPYFGFTQKSGLTNIGEYIFRNSVTPEMQVDKLVQFAFDKLSARKFAILFPNDTYGVEFSNIFWDHILARGGEVTAAQSYDPKETDFTDAVQKLVGTYYIEARAKEYKDRLKEIQETKDLAAKTAQKPVAKRSSRDHWADENILSPIVDFDVLFVPDSSRALGQILAFMSYNDVKDMKYLGTNIWSSPDLPKRAANHAAEVYFVDALDNTQAASEASTFFKDYLSLYNEEPTLTEIQSYEAAKIIKEQIVSGATTRYSLASNLRYLGRRTGVTGELRMSSQREIERPIHVLSLESGLLKKIE